MRLKWWQRTQTRAMIGLLAVRASPVSSPGATQHAASQRAWLFPTFSEPVAQNLTGLPARFYQGEHDGGPQAWLGIEGQLAAADPVQGVSISGAGKWPVVPGRRPPLAPPTPVSTDREGI